MDIQQAFDIAFHQADAGIPPEGDTLKAEIVAFAARRECHNFRLEGVSLRRNPRVGLVECDIKSLLDVHCIPPAAQVRGTVPPNSKSPWAGSGLSMPTQ